MTEFVGLLFSLGVLAVVGAGFAAIFGLAPLRARFFGAAVVLVVAALALPIAASFMSSLATAAVSGVERGVSFIDRIPPWIPLLLGAGYAALLVVLIRHRGGPSARGRDAEELRAQTRERRRLPPRGEQV